MNFFVELGKSAANYGASMSQYHVPSGPEPPQPTGPPQPSGQPMHPMQIKQPATPAQPGRTWGQWAGSFAKPYTPSMQGTDWKKQPEGSALGPWKAMYGVANVATMGRAGMAGQASKGLLGNIGGMFLGGSMKQQIGTNIANNAMSGGDDSYFYNPERFRHEHSVNVSPGTGKDPAAYGAYIGANLLSNLPKTLVNGIPMIASDLYNAGVKW